MATILDTLVAEIVFKGDTKALDNVNQRLKQFSTNLNAMGRKFGLAGGAITAFSGLSLKSFAGFDDALTQSLAIMEDVSDAIRKDMAKAAKDVALTTRFSAKDAAASYFFLASAGLDAKQSIEALPQVAQFAQAGMFDMARATDLLTDAQSALGLTVKDDVAANMRNMVRVSDTLVAANQKANATVQQFSEALTNRAGAALRALGKDVEEGVAVLAAYADQGEKGQRAGEQLNIVLRDLQKSALDNRSAFDQAGVTVFDASGEMANLGEIIGDLEDHLAGLSDEQKRVALTTLGFQERSLSSLVTLMGTSDAIRDYEAALRDATGTTQSVAEKQLQSLAAQFDLLKSHVEVAMINIGGAIAPLVETLFGPLRAALSWVSGLFESNNRFARIAAQGVAILGGGLVVLSGVLFGTALAVKGYAFALTTLKIPQMIATLWNSNFILSLRFAAIAVTDFAVRLWTSGTAALGRFATSVRTNAIPALSRFAATIWTSSVGALKALATRLTMAGAAMLRFSGRAMAAGIAGVVAFAASIWTGAVPALAAFAAGVWATTVAMLANPVGLIVLGIAALIAALVLLVKHWDTVKRVVRDFFDRYGNYVLAALAVAMPFIGIPLLIARNWSRIVGVVRGIWGTIVGIFRDHWAKILAVIFPAVGIPILVAQEWDQIVGIVGGIWSRVYDTVKGWIDAIISFIKEIPNMVTEAVKDIPVVGQVLDVAGGVADKAKGFLGGIGKVFTGAEGGIVPGPLGRPVPSIIHGGEMVLPVGASRVIAQMLEGFRLGPAALPQAPHYYGQMYRSSVTNRTVNINMNEPIVIHTQATDAKGIAQELGEAFQDQIRNVAYDHDGPVER